MDRAEKTREDRLRRMAVRQGMRIEKSRRRDPRAYDYGGYMLATENNCAVLGAHPFAYSATLDDIEEYLLDDGEAAPEADAPAEKRGATR